MGASKTSTQMHLGSESQIRLPNVDEILDIGHAIYTVDSPVMVGTNDYQVANRQLEAFLRLKPRRGTPEVPYLQGMTGVARGYARDLKRARNEWVQDLRGAQDERSRREKQLRDGSITKQGLNVLWRFVGPLILALSGLLFAQVVGETVPTAVVETTGRGIPSVLMSLAFLFIGRNLSVWFYNRQVGQITVAYDGRVFLADKAYASKKMIAIRYWRARGCEEWKQYTGKPYPRTASYLMVMKSDAITLQEQRDHIILNRKTEFERGMEVAKSLIRWGRSRPWIFRRKRIPTT